MNKQSYLCFLSLIWFTYLLNPFLGYSQNQVEYHPSRIIVQLKANQSSVMRKADEGNALTINHVAIQSLNQKYAVDRIEDLGSSVLPNGPRNRAIDRIAIIDFKQDIDMQKVIAAYKATGLFEYVERDYIGHDDLVPTDQYAVAGGGTSNDLWGLDNDGSFTNTGYNPVVAGADTEARKAWDITTGSTSIVIAIVDSGVNPSNVDLDNNMWVNADETLNGADSDGNGFTDDTRGYVFLSSPSGSCGAGSDNDPTDDRGHGTHVASEAAAEGNNNSDGGGSFKGGVLGMAWTCKIMPVKVNDCTGSGLYSDWVKGIKYAVDNGAHVINMSLSGTSFSSALQTGVNYAYENGVMIICSMSNSNAEEVRYPAAYAHTIAVGGSNANDERSTSFGGGTGGSNYYRHNEIIAPGNLIRGASHTNNTGSLNMSGTSMSTPYVTGVAALLLSVNSSLNPSEVRLALHKGVEDQVGNGTEDVAGWDKYHGYGRLNAFNSVNGVNTSASYGKITTFPYNESFESGPGSWTAGGTNTYSWTWGAPTGGNINSASAGTKAWTMKSATDLPVHSTYNANELSFVESPVFDFSTLTAPQIALDIYVDAEANTDGAVLQYSTDNGVNWTVLGAVNGCNSANWYDNTVTSLGSDGWSSSTSGWVTAKHDLSAVAGQSKVQFRFLFQSNGSTQNEGFAFDNIIIKETPTTTYTSGAWSSGNPDSFTHAVINEAYTSTGDITCQNLTLNAILTLDAGHNLTIYGTTTNPNNIAANRTSTVTMNGCSAQNISGEFGNLVIKNTNGVNFNSSTTVERMLDLQIGAVITAGNLILKSDIADTGMIGFNGGSITGIATMQRYLPDNSAQTWATAITGDYYRYFSIPFTDETVNGITATGYAQEIAQATTFNTNWNQTINPFPNFFLYDESRLSATDANTSSLSKGWNVPTAAGNLLTSGRGFLTHIGDEVVASSTGTLQTGDVTLNDVNTGGLTNSGWHLLGNPYAAPIDLPTFLSDNSAVLDQSAYLLISNTSGDSWLSYVSNVITPASLNGWDKKVSSMQGFFTKVKASPTGTTVNFTRDNIVQKTYNNPNFYRRQETRPLLRLQIQNGDYQDEVVCYFEEGSYQNFDTDKDAHKFGYNGVGWPTLFMPLENEQKLSINGLPLTEGIVPLSLWVEQEGAHIFNTLENINFEGFLGIYLEDREKDIFTKLEQGVSYSFDAPKGLQQERFFIHFSIKDPTAPEEPTALETSWEEAGIYAFSTGKNIQLNILQPNGKIIQAKLYDLQGREISIWNGIRTSKTLTVAKNVPTGIYLLQVISEGSVLRKRLFIE